jgi:hypothetical protein
MEAPPNAAHRIDSRQYEPTPLAPRQARQFISDLADRWACRGSLKRLEVLTSELVADALRHAPSRIVLHAELRGDLMRIDVNDDPGLISDASAGQLERQVARRIVDTLAGSWGSDLERGSTTTWFSMRVHDNVSVDAPRARDLVGRGAGPV